MATIEERVENLENALATVMFAKEFGPKDGEAQWGASGKPDVIERPVTVVEAFRLGLGVSTEDLNTRLSLTVDGQTVSEPAQIEEQGDAVRAFREGLGVEPAIETRPSAKEFKYRMGSPERWARFAGWAR